MSLFLSFSTYDISLTSFLLSGNLKSLLSSVLLCQDSLVMTTVMLRNAVPHLKPRFGCKADESIAALNIQIQYSLLSNSDLPLFTILPN